VRIPFAESSGLTAAARRAWLIRLALTGALATLLLAAFAAVPGGAVTSSRRTGGTMVVLDVSGSIEGNDFPAAGRALEQAAHEAGSAGAGLVLFSDSAQEALPPGTPTRELLRFRRYFGGPPTAGLQGGEATLQALRKKASSTLPVPLSPTTALNPWQPEFSSGTAISTGIAQARAALGSKGRIIVISDFVDSAWDSRPFQKQLVAIARTPGLQLQPIPLLTFVPGGAAPYLKLVDRLVPRAQNADGTTTTSTRASFPGWLVVLGGLVAAALAANELLAVSLRFREAKA